MQINNTWENPVFDGIGIKLMRPLVGYTHIDAINLKKNKI
jgi:hypothetical protein